LRLVLSVPGETNMQIDAMAFGVDTSQWPAPDVKQVRVVYRLDVNEYNGLRKVQLLVEYLDVLQVMGSPGSA
jgi:single-stranded-DNA-specific exonuclease